jgi:hypothetical protein
VKKLQFIIARTTEEFDNYGVAYLKANRGEYFVNSTFLANSYRVVYVVDAKQPDKILAGFTINIDCEKNCRYLSLLDEESRKKCITDMKMLNILLPDLVECVAIFCGEELSLYERVRVFVKAIRMSKESGKKATLAGSFIKSFRKSLHSVYHKGLYEGNAQNGRYFGLYVDFNNVVIQHLITAIPLYFIDKISRQTSKIASQIAASVFY